MELGEFGADRRAAGEVTDDKGRRVLQSGVFFTQKK